MTIGIFIGLAYGLLLGTILGILLSPILLNKKEVAEQSANCTTTKDNTNNQIILDKRV